MSDDLWLDAPENAYAQWQREEATGADRRAFADQSIVQHRSMFSRFNDYLIAHHATVASYGADTSTVSSPILRRTAPPAPLHGFGT